MTKHALFLKWWLFFTVVCVGFIYAVGIGAIETLWDKDATKLSFVLLALFGFVSAWCGYKTWTLSKFLDSGREDEHIVEKIDHLIEVGWFSSDLCLTIGMIGTVSGFIMMLSGFYTVDVSQVETIQELIKQLGAGMSTALYSTLVGLICSALLKIQYFNLNQAIDRIRK